MFALKFKLIEKSVISLFLFLTQFGLISPNLPLQAGREAGLEGAANEYANTPLRGSKQYPGQNNLLGFRWVFF